uniref:Uncharacterized protein n=1 Tax=Sinocyclocheilus grahami TaxID=75366 RepID=A0A672K673_SINGR
METPEPGQADGEERMMELRPRTRSNPEGAEDRLASPPPPPPPQPAVGSRVEGEGEAASSDSPPTSATPSMSTQIPPSAELHLRAPRVNCPEKVVQDERLKYFTEND